MDAASAQIHSSSHALAPNRLIFTPVAETAPSVAGLVRSYDAGAAGLSVQLTAEVAPRAAEQLDGQRAWVTANIGGTLIAFQAVARRTTETSLDANGITVPVEEHRRGQLRATTRIPAHLRFPHVAGQAPTLVAGHIIDLSRGGCRMQLPSRGVRQALPPVGTSADVTLDLATHPAVVTCDVLRVDPDAGHAVLRFTQLAAEDGDRIERHVLGLLVS